MWADNSAQALAAKARVGGAICPAAIVTREPVAGLAEAHDRQFVTIVSLVDTTALGTNGRAVGEHYAISAFVYQVGPATKRVALRQVLLDTVYHMPRQLDEGMILMGVSVHKVASKIADDKWAVFGTGKNHPFRPLLTACLQAAGFTNIKDLLGAGFRG
eukprot:13104538-Heterocapsa_arctica.AAC.1